MDETEQCSLSAFSLIVKAGSNWSYGMRCLTVQRYEIVSFLT